MTMPHERSRALVWAGGLLIELARDKALPLNLRRRAVAIARHFPTIEQIDAMAISDQFYGLGLPSKQSSWTEQCKFGPLHYGTRLEWPSDDMQADTEGIEEVLARATAIAGTHARAKQWLSEPLPTFGGKTPIELVEANRTQDLLDYLETVEAGFLG